MQTQQAKVLESLRAVNAFLDENADTLAAVVQTGARQKLNQAIADLSTHVSDQSGNHLASQGATQKLLELRKALLRDHMAPIASIAQADLPSTPEVLPLKMPKGRPSAEKLAGLAYGMGKAAAPFSTVFTSSGLPQDFIARLNTAADAFKLSLTERATNEGKGAGATTDLKTRLTSARKTLKVLNSFVRSALKDSPGLLRNWNSVKHVNKVAGRPAAPTPTAPVNGSTPAPITPTPSTPTTSAPAVSPVHAPPTAGLTVEGKS